MELSTFKLEQYDDDKLEHRRTLVELWNDPISREYLYDLTKETRYIDEKNLEDNRNNAYIVYFENEIIGYISIMGENNRFHISYGITPEHRGKKLASPLLKEFTSEIFKNYETIDELVLVINRKNIVSQKVATNAGYQKDSIIRYIKTRNA